jgi:hypothetical protein
MATGPSPDRASTTDFHARKQRDGQRLVNPAFARTAFSAASFSLPGAAHRRESRDRAASSLEFAGGPSLITYGCTIACLV